MIPLEVACKRFETIQEVMNTIAYRSDTDAYQERNDTRNIAKAVADICYTMRQLYDMTGGIPHGENTVQKENEG